MTQPSFVEPEAADYLRDVSEALEPDAFAAIRRAAEDANGPVIGVETGRALAALVAATGARRVLEVGTLFGYSAACMAAALPAGGRVDTIEMDPATASRAERLLADAGVGDRVTVHRGRALDVLPTLDGPFDFAFLDAAKSELPQYLEHARRLLRPGGTVTADNVLWSGRVWSVDAMDDDTEGVREFTRAIREDPGLVTCILPVGDGLSVSVLKP